LKVNQTPNRGAGGWSRAFEHNRMSTPNARSPAGARPTARRACWIAPSIGTMQKTKGVAPRCADQQLLLFVVSQVCVAARPHPEAQYTRARQHRLADLSVAAFPPSSLTGPRPPAPGVGPAGAPAFPSGCAGLATWTLRPVAAAVARISLVKYPC
jgi:hypothetical protein